MDRIEVINGIREKLESKGIFALTCEEFLPETFLEDMKERFGCNPEMDIISNVGWNYDEMCAYCTGALTYLGGISRDEALKKIQDYVNEKDIVELHVLAVNDKDYYSCYCFENKYEGYDEELEVLLLDEHYPCPDDLMGICLADATVGFTYVGDDK